MKIFQFTVIALLAIFLLVKCAGIASAIFVPIFLFVVLICMVGIMGESSRIDKKH